jgi:hypothetical protein
MDRSIISMIAIETLQAGPPEFVACVPERRDEGLPTLSGERSARIVGCATVSAGDTLKGLPDLD